MDYFMHAVSTIILFQTFSLQKFEDARNISGSHRAFKIYTVDEHSVQITFTPTNECILRSKRIKSQVNRFVVDMRLIQADSIRCCVSEFHAEISRYYLSGQYEHVKLSHEPDILNFSQVVLNTKETKHLLIRNESKCISAKLKYCRTVGIQVIPQKFCIQPQTTKKLLLIVKPNSLKIDNKIIFHVSNPYNISLKSINGQCIINDEENILPYKITCKIMVICQKRSRKIMVESMHKLYEPNPSHTFVNDEILNARLRRDMAMNYFKKSKLSRQYRIEPMLRLREKEKCQTHLKDEIISQAHEFCEEENKILSIYDVFRILPHPISVDFGRVGPSSYAKRELIINNSSSSEITLHFFSHEYIFYTEKKEHNSKINVKPNRKRKLSLFCFSCKEGSYSGYFEYNINQRYNRKHAYNFQVDSPSIMLSEKSLKFGMVTMETFVTNIPVKITNYFNVAINFKWITPHDDVPFEVIPDQCCLPGHTSRMCDVIYKCKPTKAKLFEINFIHQKEIVPIELNIVTRKLSIKFLKSQITFNDLALNLETVEKVKLENSSREVAFFYIVEPLVPGFKIEPMSGVIGPKMIITFDIIVKISCLIDFSFDLILKINNKENLFLPINGNVIEPRINIIPKTINMPRIPSNLTTYVQVMIQNTSHVKSEIEVLETDDDKCFNVYVQKGNEKQRVLKLDIDGGQSKSIFIRVNGNYRREYDFYLPFRVNDLIGPPNNNPQSLDYRYYTETNEHCYESNAKVKIKSVNKEISYCRLVGVISLPQLEFSVESYEIIYKLNNSNIIEFTMKNVSKTNLLITIIISKLMPNFSLSLLSKDHSIFTSENGIKFELSPLSVASFRLKFHPKSHGKFVSTALLYLDTFMTTPYYDLTFIGVNELPIITSNTTRIILPPCHVGAKASRAVLLKVNAIWDIDSLSFTTDEREFITVQLLKTTIIKNEMKRDYTIISGVITVSSHIPIDTNSTVSFKHSSGSSYDIEVKFCFTYCPLTLHASSIINIDDNPYPYYPDNNHPLLLNYMEECLEFLEQWLFYQGFRKELYPKIPDTLNALSCAMSSQSKDKSKGINVSYLNFVKRIVGPLIKHVHKITLTDTDETVKQVKEVYYSYKEIFNLLKVRGANLWALEPKYLLSHEQFIVYSSNVPTKNAADEKFTGEILKNEALYKRLNKQSWIDFILQTYKVFVFDSCFFDCMCVNSQSRDITTVLINWYNEHLQRRYNPFKSKNIKVKYIKNITIDLSDGVAIISAFLNYCSFLCNHFSISSDECTSEGGRINNACLIIEALSLLRINFPISSKDFIKPNFLQMLFLSINLYVVLPMFNPKDIITYSPPLLATSSRKITISPQCQESLTFSYFLLNNPKNYFMIEKVLTGDNGKKVFVNVTYTANFVEENTSILLVHGYNKTRIYDTYLIFVLSGKVEILAPTRKCKVVGPNYRQQKVDILVSSPFTTISTYRMYIFDKEPSIPLAINNDEKFRFYARRLNLIDKEIILTGIPKESGQEVIEHKVYFLLICLDSQINNTWVWFRSDIGEFFIKVTTQPRCDMYIDTLYAYVDKWPLVPCCCGEACECYRTTILTIPNRNEAMIKSLRCALAENASVKMLEKFDQLIETATGRIILSMLLVEGGMNSSEIEHILRNDTSFRVTARALVPHFDQVTITQHTETTLTLPITVHPLDKPEKYSVTFTSDCGMDVRTYKVYLAQDSLAKGPSLNN